MTVSFEINEGNLAFFRYKISLMVGFIPLVSLRDFNDDWFHSPKRLQWRSGLFGCEILMMSVLLGYEISVTAGFVRLCDLNDGKFVPLRDLNDIQFSVTVGIVALFFFTRFQKQTVLFRYEISMMIGFIPLRD